MHRPVAEQREWLSAVLRGHFAYYGLQGNMHSMVSFAYGAATAPWRLMKA
jgi:hypothetical protein